MKRISLGIKGLDKMIEGGVPEGSVIGLSGPPGVGKSIIALHYLLEGARKNEKGVYINLEEPLSNIENLISQFDFSKEFFEFIKQKKIIIKCFDYDEYEKINESLLKQIYEDNSIKRFVVDSFNCFFCAVNSEDIENLSGTIKIENKINKTIKVIRRQGLTTILILENDDSSHNRLYNIPYLVDGIIDLDFLDMGIIERRVFIKKMRWTNQYKESKEFLIGKKGIKIIDERD